MTQLRTHFPRIGTVLTADVVPWVSPLFVMEEVSKSLLCETEGEHQAEVGQKLQ